MSMIPVMTIRVHVRRFNFVVSVSILFDESANRVTCVRLSAVIRASSLVSFAILHNRRLSMIALTTGYMGRGSELCSLSNRQKAVHRSKLENFSGVPFTYSSSTMKTRVLSLLSERTGRLWKNPGGCGGDLAVVAFRSSDPALTNDSLSIQRGGDRSKPIGLRNPPVSSKILLNRYSLHA